MTPNIHHASDRAHHTLQLLQQIRVEKKKLADEETELLDVLREEFSGAELILYRNEPVAKGATVSSRRIDSKRLRDEYPDVAAACTVTSESYRITILGGDQ